MYKIIVVCLLGVILAGCATGYHEKGMTGGYESQQLSNNVTQVTYKGNGFSTPDQVYQFALRRSAELAAKKGYTYFVVLSNNSHLGSDHFENQYGNFNRSYPITELRVKFTHNKLAKALRASDVIAAAKGS